MEHRRIPLPRPSRLAILPPDLIGEAIDRLLDALDRRDGDPDLEDSEAGETAITDRGRFLHEDKIGFGGLGSRAEDSEQASPEWHSLGRHKVPNWTGSLPHEDAEDDDPDTGQDEGEPNFVTPPPGEGAGCSISDPDYGIEDQGELVNEDGSGWAERDWPVRLTDRPAPTEAAHPEPEDLPDLFASTCSGTCLEPVYRDGCLLVFSKTEAIKAGDYVGVWFQPGVMREGEPQCMVKRLAMNMMPGIAFPFTLSPSSNCEPMIVLEMLNPPRRFTFRASQIRAMFKVVGEAEPVQPGVARFVPERQESARVGQ